MLKRHSMQQRMTLWFAVPLIVVQLILFWMFVPYVSRNFTGMMKQSVQQSFDQAASFVDSYIQNMQLLAQIVENNGEVQNILFSENFQSERPIDEQYYEFYSLNKALDAIEFSNSVYRFGLYIPDDVVYSNNDYYFFKSSELEKRADYADIQKQLGKGKDYLAISQRKMQASDENLTTMVTLFHPIRDEKRISTDFWICTVSVDATRFQNVMEYADITEHGLTCLLNQEGQKMVASDETLLAQMKGEELFKENKSISWERKKLNGSSYYVLDHVFAESGLNMFTLIPVKEYGVQYRILLLLIGSMILVMVIIIGMASFLLSGYYVNRLRVLCAEMQNLQGGNLNAQLPDLQNDDEIEEVYHNFNFMVEEVQRLMQEQYKLGKNVQAAEIRALQAQINPHFLYNTLDLVNWIAMDYGAEEIEKIAWNLARFYRLSLNHGKSLISIRDEIEHMQVYINLQNYHYDDAIRIQTEVDEELLDLACLNIILQPFVENCIVHGIAENPEITECNIHVQIQRDGKDILLCVKDDGPGMTAQQMEDAVSMDSRKLEKGYGIKNINFRIKLCFGEEYGVRYESVLGEGTSAYIRIPAMTVEEAEKVVL